MMGFLEVLDWRDVASGFRLNAQGKRTPCSPGRMSAGELPGGVLARAAKMVEDVAERTQSQGEVCGGDGAPREVGAELAACVDAAGAADGVDLAEEEGDEPETGHAPAALGDQQRGVGKNGGGQMARGQVRPEDKLRVAGDPALECGVSVVVR